LAVEFLFGADRIDHYAVDCDGEGRLRYRGELTGSEKMHPRAMFELGRIGRPSHRNNDKKQHCQQDGKSLAADLYRVVVPTQG
jgi:hypothetical protein